MANHHNEAITVLITITEPNGIEHYRVKVIRESMNACLTRAWNRSHRERASFTIGWSGKVESLRGYLRHQPSNITTNGSYVNDYNDLKARGI